MEKEKKLKIGGCVKSIKGRVVEGFASVFGNIDSYGDIVHPGAFLKTIQEQAERIKHLGLHDSWKIPTAVILELRETGREELPEEVQEGYPEATGGLLVVREYLNTQDGNEMLEAIVKKAITEMSFMFNRVRWDYETVGEGADEHRICHLRELRLWETSDVIWGANPATVSSKGMGNDKVRDLLWMQQMLKSGCTSRGFSPEKSARLMALLEQFGDELTAAPRRDDEKTSSLGQARTAELFAELDLFELTI